MNIYLMIHFYLLNIYCKNTILLTITIKFDLISIYYSFFISNILRYFIGIQLLLLLSILFIILLKIL